MDESQPAPRALMACLGDASRFRLVKALLGGARCVTDLATEVGLSQSCTTRHLQALERRQVVQGARDGKRVLYRIRDEDPGLMPLLVWAMESTEGSARARGPIAAAGPGRRTASGPSIGTAIGGDHPRPRGGTATSTVRPANAGPTARSGPGIQLDPGSLLGTGPQLDPGPRSGSGMQLDPGSLPGTGPQLDPGPRSASGLPLDPGSLPVPPTRPARVVRGRRSDIEDFLL